MIISSSLLHVYTSWGSRCFNRLENVCILERIYGGSAVKMHELTSDMAFQTPEENSAVMVKAGAQRS